MSATQERIAILCSGDPRTGGGGSTAEKVARDSLTQKVGFTVGVVICSNEREKVAVHDRFDTINSDFGLRGDRRIDVVTINAATHPATGPGKRGQTPAESSAICRTLERYDIGFAAMLGYMRIATEEFIEEYGWQPEYGAEDPTHNGIYHARARLLNNHPGILPFTADTSGHRTHEKAVNLFSEGTITHTAMTYHLASAGVDTGPVVYAEPVPIPKTDTADTLGDRVQYVEKAMTAFVIERHLTLRSQHLQAAA